MYYEEQWIDGKLCWRSSPDGEWAAFTLYELGQRYQAESKRRYAHEATIADLQGQLKAAEKIVRDLCEKANVHHPDCIIRDLTSLQQRVAQLEGALERVANVPVDGDGRDYYWEGRDIAKQAIGKPTSERYTSLQADHTRVLELVQALGVPERYVVSVDDHGGQIRLPDGYVLFTSTSRTRTYALENLFDYVLAASLPAQPAQGGVK